jgi:2-polyprenyl-3-methyl-5-hydroxy-6-metoxy-1,4-benzoquinol methylase
MSEFEFDFEGVFDDDYLHFYEPLLGERTAEDVEKIVELLELEPGAEILDCPCGHGRISNALAARGFRVSGVDASDLFLARARADAQAQGVDVEYVKGDMRDLRWRDRFGGLVNWFTSFGYFTDEQNKAVLRGFHDALRPGGRLILDTQNITRVLLQPRPQHWLERDGDLMLDEWKLDVENARFVTERTVVRGGNTRRTHFVVRWFSVPELRAWLEEAGFENVRAPGLEPQTRLVVVADRRAER